ncbi:putative ADP-ribosyl glycohydrolase L543 [Chlorella vulgaris]
MSGTYDRGVGAVCGALVGDAAGAPLEFTLPYPEDVDHALLFGGGGPFCVGPGQGTDDSELTMACVSGLLANSAPAAVALAQRYDAWFNSGPFDTGATCRRAFGTGLGTGDMEARFTAVMKLNYFSKANGALMRATPIAARYHASPDLDSMASLDARLSHPNPVCVDANRVYCATIAALIRTGDRAVALDLIDSMDDVEKEVRAMIAESRCGPPQDATVQAGYLKWGFTAALAHLRLGSTYEQAIRQVLSAGGDTDTNAAIVGGVMGALWGLQGIPQAWRDAVLLPASTDEHQRPPWLSSRQFLDLAPRLLGRECPVSGGDGGGDS